MKRVTMKYLRYFCIFLLVECFINPKTHTVYAMIEESGDDCKTTQSNGFQGCVNREQCGNYGYYLARYSQEGLCRQCEFELFPERYVACPFCRAPMYKCGKQMLSFICHCCLSKVQGMLISLLQMNNDWKHIHALELGIFRYLIASEHTIQRNSIAAVGAYTNAFNYEWPGFYCGALRLPNGALRHVWSKKIVIDPNDKIFITNIDDGEAFAEFICQKYKIFGPETGTEISENDIPADGIFYEEHKKNQN